MPTLLEEIAASRAKMRSRAQTDYVTLLGRAGDPKKGDAARLVNVLELLHITEAQFQKDAALAESIPRTIAFVGEMGEHQAELKRLAAVRDKMVAPDRREQPKERKVFDDTMRQHNCNVNMHVAGVHRGKDADEQLKRLREENWWFTAFTQEIQT